MDYSEQIENLKKIISISEKVLSSLSESSSSSYRLQWIADLFRKMIGQSKSILTLLPRPDQTADQDLDLSSIASLTRNLGDSYEALYYFGVDEIKKDEAEFRFLLMKLQMKLKLKEIQEALGDDKQEIQKTDNEIDSIKQQIKNSSFWLNLTQADSYGIYDWVKKINNQNQKDFDREIKNRKGRCLPRKEVVKRIMERISLNNILDGKIVSVEEGVKRFEGIDTYCSSHTHSSPLAITETKYEIEVGDETRHFFSLMIRHSVFYLCMAVFDFVELLEKHEITADISSSEKNIVAQSICSYLIALKVIA